MTMTDPNDVRRQFEAAMKEKWGSFIATRDDHGYAHDPENCAWIGYNAALQSPAVRELVVALDSIQQYGSDTLSGRVDGPNDRDWQRAGVQEMTRRARVALAPFAALRTLGAGHVE